MQHELVWWIPFIPSSASSSAGAKQSSDAAAREQLEKVVEVLVTGECLVVYLTTYHLPDADAGAAAGVTSV